MLLEIYICSIVILLYLYFHDFEYMMDELKKKMPDVMAEKFKGVLIVACAVLPIIPAMNTYWVFEYLYIRYIKKED